MRRLYDEGQVLVFESRPGEAKLVAIAALGSATVAAVFGNLDGFDPNTLWVFLPAAMIAGFCFMASREIDLRLDGRDRRIYLTERGLNGRRCDDWAFESITEVRLREGQISRYQRGHILELVDTRGEATFLSAGQRYENLDEIATALRRRLGLADAEGVAG